MATIEAQYQVWEAAELKHDSRPQLTEVWIERVDSTRGLACAADGFILAVVPMTLHPDDVPGFVSVDVLKAARKLCKKGDAMYFTLEATTVRLTNGVVMPRSKLENGRTFPDYNRIVPNFPGESELGSLGFNPAYIGRIQKALGFDGQPMALSASAADKPYIITASQNLGAPGTRPVAPFAILMPMLIAKAGTASSTRQAA